MFVGVLLYVCLKNVCCAEPGQPLVRECIVLYPQKSSILKEDDRCKLHFRSKMVVQAYRYSPFQAQRSGNGSDFLPTRINQSIYISLHASNKLLTENGTPKIRSPSPSYQILAGALIELRTKLYLIVRKTAHFWKSMIRVGIIR